MEFCQQFYHFGGNSYCFEHYLRKSVLQLKVILIDHSQSQITKCIVKENPIGKAISGQPHLISYVFAIFSNDMSAFSNDRLKERIKLQGN